MDSDPLKDDRQTRIAELERRIARSSGVGVKAPVAVIAILLSLGLLWEMRRDLAYYFGSREPITLGTEGDYHFEALRSNTWAQVHGIPTTRGAYSEEKGQVFVMVGLRDTPLAVRRPGLVGERPPLQPSQTPFAVRGRLLSREDAPRYEDGFKLLADMGEVRPHGGKLWVLIEGERPGGDTLTGLLSSLLVAFALLNGWFLWRELSHRLRARA
ncbi:MAG: hypothetical protein ACYC8T_22970 [Myxococcaceae bacterium]